MGRTASSELCLVILSASSCSRRRRRARALVCAGLVDGADGRQPAADGVFAAAGVPLRRRATTGRACSCFAGLPALVGVAAAGLQLRRLQHAPAATAASRTSTARCSAGVAGLLLSPNRGLLVYTPIMLFALWGAVRVWRRRGAAVAALAERRRSLLHVLVYAQVQGMVGGLHVRAALFHRRAAGADDLSRLRAGAAAAARAPMRVVAVGARAVRRRRAGDRRVRRRRSLESRAGAARASPAAGVGLGRSADRARAGTTAGTPASSRRVMLDAFRDPVPARVAPLDRAPIWRAPSRRAVVPTTMRRGGSVDAACAEITNSSNVAWPAFSGEGAISARYLVFLLVRWLADGAGDPGVGDVIAAAARTSRPARRCGCRFVCRRRR